MIRPIVVIAVVLATTACTVVRGRDDASLTSYVDTLTAIDSHAHPMAFVASGAPADTDYDALPLDGIPAFDLPLGLRPGTPLYRRAQRALFGLSGGDSGSATAAAFDQLRARTIQQHGTAFPAWVLDQLHIGVMLANRVAMGNGLTPPRFRWVAFSDPLMLPLDNHAVATTPDTRALYPLEAKLLRRYLRDLGLSALPTTLAAYQHDVVSATLEKERAAGAVSIKFEAAYLRSLDFEPADSSVAAQVYARFANGGTPPAAAYRTLQDYLVRYITREAGRLGMAVQIHTTEGFGGYYSAAGAAPHLLESLFNDSTLRGTHFIVIHGGWPLVEETMSQLSKPNVYTDISMMDQLAEPAALVRTLRMWLAEWPGKVLFGTDAFDGGDEQGWEQVAWVATHNARQALATALDGMVRDSEVTPARARELARMVLHDNALKAYPLIGSGVAPSSPAAGDRHP